MSDYLVYMHTNKINNKRYIGITHYTDRPERRWGNGSGYFRNKHFNDAIKKYGWDNFEHNILASGLSKDDACSLERDFIRLFNTQDKRCGYNITDGGETFRHTEESKRLISERRKGKGLHEFTEEHKRHMRESHAGGNPKKSVRCIETGRVYESINDAARDVGINKKVISSCCRKVPHYNTAKGYHWEFA